MTARRVGVKRWFNPARHGAMLGELMGLKPRREPAQTVTTGASAGTGDGVDGYLRALPEPTRPVATELRALVRRAAPGSAECIKWGVPVFELETPVCYLSAHTGYVRLGFYRGTDLDDPRQLLEGTGARLRHVKVAGNEPVARADLEALVRQAARLARSG